MRAERLQVETEIMLFPFVVHKPQPGELADSVGTVSVGLVRDLARYRGLVVGIWR